MAKKTVFQDPDVPRKKFVDELGRARDRVGSVLKLAFALGVHPRRVNYWLVGKGPTRNKMAAIMPELKSIK